MRPLSGWAELAHLQPLTRIRHGVKPVQAAAGGMPARASDRFCFDENAHKKHPTTVDAAVVGCDASDPQINKNRTDLDAESKQVG